MAAPAMQPIANITLGAASSSVIFSSIPQTYRDLRIVISASPQTTAVPSVTGQFNGDGGSNYSGLRMTGNGVSAGSATFTGTFNNWASAFGLGTSTTDTAVVVVDVMDYSATDKHKTSLCRNGVANLGVESMVSRWANTAAITSVSVTATGDQFKAGSTFTLYGVLA